MVLNMQYQKETGISLIVVLWMLVILTVIALAFSRQLRTEVQLTANYQNQAKAVALAEAGIWRAVMMVSNKNAASVLGETIYLDGRVYDLDSDDGDLKVSMQSTQGLVDLNRAPENLIRNLVQKVAISSEQVDTVTAALLDWRDEDDLRRLSGAEKADYLAKDLGVVPTNGPLVSVAELARLYGINSEIYWALRPYVTVVSGDARIDVTTAPSFVLSALPGMTETSVSNILAAREDPTQTLDLTLLPVEARQYIGASQVRIVQLRSQAQAGHLKAGIVAEVEFRTAGQSPVVVLSWVQGTDDVFTQYKTEEIVVSQQASSL